MFTMPKIVPVIHQLSPAPGNVGSCRTVIGHVSAMLPAKSLTNAVQISRRCASLAADVASPDT